MHSEEDTFNKLRKITPKELAFYVAGVPTEEWYSMTQLDKENFFKKVGWTWEDWSNFHD